jgi:hypothetical protein
MTHNLSFRYHADTTKGLRLGLGSAKVEVLQTLYKAKSPATLVRVECILFCNLQAGANARRIGDRLI